MLPGLKDSTKADRSAYLDSLALKAADAATTAHSKLIYAALYFLGPAMQPVTLPLF